VSRVQVIAAEGEWKAARALKEASDVINESSSALQLRYLQTLTAISAEKNSTIIFPLPIDLLSAFMTGGNQRNRRGSVTGSGSLGGNVAGGDNGSAGGHSPVTESKPI